MPTLENYTRTLGTSSTKYTGRVTQTNSRSLGDVSLYRNGTGRRPKPKVLDETFYERKQLLISNPIGKGSSVYKQYPTNNIQWEGVFPSTGSFLNPGRQWRDGTINLTDVSDMATIRAYEAFDRRDMDLGTAWKEREKTVNLVRGVATTAVEALRDIKNRDGRGLLNTLGLDHRNARNKGVVDSYLAYHYGMKPLLQDVNGAVNALARLSYEHWGVRGVGKQTYVTQKTTECALETESAALVYSTFRRAARTELTAIPRPLTREQDLQWALGLDNPLASRWELTPFSFVVDWLVPIGDWLQAHNSFKYYTGWQGILSQKWKEDCLVEPLNHSRNGGEHTWTSLKKGIEMRLHVRRTITSVPLPGLPIKDPRSIDHMAKALSLMASRSANSADFRQIIRY